MYYTLENIQIELTWSTWNPFKNDPPEDKNRRVVVHMQESQLTVVLPNHNEECIQEFDDFAEKVRPHVVDDLRRKFAWNVIEISLYNHSEITQFSSVHLRVCRKNPWRLTREAVIELECRVNQFVCNEEVQAGHGPVVGD